MESKNKELKYLLNHLTCNEMDRAWDLFYKCGEGTMKERGVNTKDWRQWIKDNKRRKIKCDKYFPTNSVEEGKAKFKELVEKTIKEWLLWGSIGL